MGILSARMLLLCTALCLGASAATAQPVDILPAERVVAGMTGYGVTDMGDGKGIQRFEVEVLGQLKRFAPGQDLILARVKGIGLENAGIIAEMSGSPIYIEGKLVGALAYGWPFAKDPICGITPIQSMLDIRHAPPAPPVPIAGATVSTPTLLSAFTNNRFGDRLDELVKAFRGQPASESLAALPLPISLGGASAPGPLFSRIAEAANWMTVPSGSAAPSAAVAEPSPLKPGSAVSTQLLSGDMDLSATGTVTWVEGNSVLAFGH